MAHKLFTLVMIKKDRKVLLGHKTRGLGVGLWNGFGGKVEPQETLMEGAKRELKEESNLDVLQLKHLGVIRYVVENDPHISIVHIFTAETFYGNIECSEEMNPIQWYNYQNIPYHKMWPDAKFWYPIMLDEKYFSAVFKYNARGKIVQKVLKEFMDNESLLKHISTEIAD